ncbi:aromatic ring-hydroxylating oxygenase subunit alpha [Nocardia farcinica]|uniref:aromatic ring-hydroxylating oxygenase subunit alpha n=1 Tax=Nocardia farcinica TaxID=37329 RepID=UPI0015EFE680|nr:Rieske (2Fe-2S) protein [Nocardia farcinica]MBF6143091.1 Rieske (2Fe-2S) protein [Nocardia farcinica]MBF6382539.1 Rieske (2Fe-2S) protein [Nocardia farcinica]
MHTAYLGEVFGAVFLADLLRTGAHAANRDDLRWLYLLEETTRRRLATHLDVAALAAQVDEHEHYCHEFATVVAGQTWQEFMRDTIRLAREALPDFELLPVLASAEARRDMAAVLDHELSLLAFATRALAGRPTDRPLRERTPREIPGPVRNREGVTMTETTTGTDTERVTASLVAGWQLPADLYYDPAVHRQKQRRIFDKAWSYVCRERDLAEPGAYVTTRVGDLPVVVVRDRDGVLHGHVNVCRHRLHPVAEGAGCRQVFQCRYHGWTYGHDGSLRAAPGLRDEDTFDRQTMGLRRGAVPQGRLMTNCESTIAMFQRRTWAALNDGGTAPTGPAAAPPRPAPGRATCVSPPRPRGSSRSNSRHPTARRSPDGNPAPTSTCA